MPDLLNPPPLRQECCFRIDRVGAYTASSAHRIAVATGKDEAELRRLEHDKELEHKTNAMENTHIQENPRTRRAAMAVASTRVGDENSIHTWQGSVVVFGCGFQLCHIETGR